VRSAALLGLSLVAGCGSTEPSAPPTIALSSSAVTLVAPPGASPTLTVAVKAGGTTPLTQVTLGPVTYQTGSGWLTAVLGASTSPATIALTASSAGLAEGQYTATIPVTAPAATNSPQTLTVTLLVLGQAGTSTLAAAGQSAVFLDGPNFATQLTLAPNAQFLIGVVNTNPSASALEDFTLVGGVASASAAPPVASIAPVPAARQAAAASAFWLHGRSDLPSATMLRRFAERHAATLRASRRRFERQVRRAPIGARPLRLQRAAARPNFAIGQTVGTVNKVYVVRDTAVSCTDVDSIGARTVAVGQHVVVLADTNTQMWGQINRPDSTFYQVLADEYDQVTWPSTQTFVGDPLAADGQLSGAGKVTVVLTPLVNKGSGIAFVNSCDFFPFATSGPDADLSNETEMIFAFVPAPNQFSVSVWQRVLRATLAHETKHVVAIGQRVLANAASLDEIWLEEGLAQVAEEIWLRNFNQAAWKSHAGFDQTVACELSGGVCNPSGAKPIGLIAAQLPFLFQYLQTQSDSLTEGLGRDAASLYGAGWILGRWVIDQYASDEATTLKALVNETQLNGFDNIGARTGQTTASTLVYWNLATAVYGTPTYTAADARITVPSFNLADIFRISQTGLVCGNPPKHCGLFTDSGEPIYPVSPVPLATGSVSKTVTGLRGTAGAFFLLTADARASGAQALQLLSGGGTQLSPSSDLRVGIVRVQ
jgi:hypothetical protein